jgi:apolipoprotein N-acyltransferase
MVHVSTFIWLFVGALLLGVVTRTPIPPLTWLALTFLLRASRSMPAMPGLIYMCLALSVALGFGNRGIIPAPGAAYLAIVISTALAFTFPFALDRLVAPRLGTVGLTLVFPLAWVAVELGSRLSQSGATWGSIAYSQYGYLPLMQVAAVTGIWGITFLVAWFASTFNYAWDHGFDWRIVRTSVLIYTGVMGVTVVGGALRLAFAPTDRPSIRTATLNRPVDLFLPGEMTQIAEGRVSADERRRFDEKLTQLQTWFLEGSRREARAGARLIVWPEINLLIFHDDEPAFVERAQRLAADEHVYLAMGIGTVHLGEALPLENKVIVIDPSGRVILSYLKSHPVFGWEAGIMRVGSGRLPVVPTTDGRIATAICYDADFPEFIRQAGRDSADLLIVPANDWKEVKAVHSHMAVFRAIENGVPLVRAAASGISSAFDSWGRVLAVTDYFAPGDRTMNAQVPLGRVPTVYARTGDLFAWLCVVCLLIALGRAAIAPAGHSADALDERHGLPRVPGASVE